MASCYTFRAFLIHVKHQSLTQQCQASLAKSSSCSQLMCNFSSLIVYSTVQRITDNAPSLQLSAASAIAVQANSHKLYILTLQTAGARCQDCCCQLRVQLTLITQWLSSMCKPITYLQ